MADSLSTALREAPRLCGQLGRESTPDSDDNFAAEHVFTCTDDGSPGRHLFFVDPDLAPVAALIILLVNHAPALAGLIEAAEAMSEAALPELCCVGDPPCRSCPRCDLRSALAALKEPVR